MLVRNLIVIIYRKLLTPSKTWATKLQLQNDIFAFRFKQPI